MRVLLDYRPALRERTGVGEYFHELARALARRMPAVDLTVFTSSWKDRLNGSARGELGAAKVIDARIPVRALNFAWHRLEWPDIESIARQSFDIVHAAHPLLIPSASAARVVTIHDLHFLDYPSQARGEVRRDYPRLVKSHAERADLIVVNSNYTRSLLGGRLELAHDRIVVCRPGAPEWGEGIAKARERDLPPQGGSHEDNPIVFLGTLEPRKNLGVLLDAHARLLSTDPDIPDLVLAGKATALARPWLDRVNRAPLAGHVHYLGYVDNAARLDLLRRARMLVLPSLDEGFGFPAVEAMACGVPVVVSTRGSLPEVVGDAGLFVDPADADGWATAILRLVQDHELSTQLTVKGRHRAREMRWDAAADALIDAYARTIAGRQSSAAHPRHRRNSTSGASNG